jgi:hypothetical protein
MEKREPLLIIATGTKSVGKTYTTCHVIANYMKDNPITGKLARKALIYDVNNEYTEKNLKEHGVNYKVEVLDIDDLPRWTAQKRVEARRILPVDKNGRYLGIDGMVELLNKILYIYRSGLLVLEDINRYMIDTKTREIIGTMATNRHRDLDIYIHLQSLAPVTPRMFQNCQIIRFHKQTDNIARIHNRVPNPELYYIAEKLVNQQYQKNKRFYCYIQNEYSKISGKFSIRDFQKACYSYVLEHPKILSNAQKRFGSGKGSRERALQFVIGDLMKYHGN